MRHFHSYSSAMRAGIAMRPVQAFSRFWDADTKATCANGAVLEAIFDEPPTMEWFLAHYEQIREVFHRDFAYLRGVKIALPCECDYLVNGPSDTDLYATAFNPSDIVVHLNNYHRWSREEIADWFETVEEGLGFVTFIEASEPAQAASGG